MAGSDFYCNFAPNMKVYRAAGELPVFRNAVVTIGTFDGVHTGHQQIIQQLKQEATAIGGETVIITFDPHPRQVIFGSTKKIQLINTLDEKIELLAKQGIDHLAVMPFTESFSQFTAEQYIREFLVAQFRPHTIIIGYDHRFGKGRAGDYHLMEAFSADCGYQLKEIPVHLINLLSVSSTRIRSAISEADISTANELLGYPFFFEAKVVAGARLGRTIGYPTANLQVENDEKIVPAMAYMRTGSRWTERKARFVFANRAAEGNDEYRHATNG